MSERRTANSSTLSQDIHTLGNWLGIILQEQHGEDTYDLVEEIRVLSKARRNGDAEAAVELADRLEKLPLDEKKVLIKAFSNYFQLINIAEDLQRIRVIRQREADGVLKESIEVAVVELRRSGKTAGQIRTLLEQIALAARAHSPPFGSEASGNPVQIGPHLGNDGAAQSTELAASGTA